MVETVDALGNADEERKFAFFGSSASPFGELTPVGMEPFRPFRFFSVQSAGSSPPPPFRPPTELTPTSFTSAVVLSLAVSLLAPAASLVTPSVSLDASPPPAAAELPPALLPPAPPWGLSPTAAPPPTPQGGLPPLPDASQSPGMADAPLPLPPLPPAPLDRPWSTPPFQLPPCPPVVQAPCRRFVPETARLRPRPSLRSPRGRPHRCHRSPPRIPLRRPRQVGSIRNRATSRMPLTSLGLRSRACTWGAWYLRPTTTTRPRLATIVQAACTRLHHLRPQTHRTAARTRWQ